MARREPRGAPPGSEPAWDFDRTSWDQAGVAIAYWLDERGSLSNRIDSLTRLEFSGMAWAAVSRYLQVREQRRQELAIRLDVYPDMPDPMEKIGDAAKAVADARQHGCHYAEGTCKECLTIAIAAIKAAISPSSVP